MFYYFFQGAFWQTFYIQENQKCRVSLPEPGYCVIKVPGFYRKTSSFPHKPENKTSRAGHFFRPATPGKNIRVKKNPQICPSCPSRLRGYYPLRGKLVFNVKKFSRRHRFYRRIYKILNISCKYKFTTCPFCTKRLNGIFKIRHHRIKSLFYLLF